MKPDLPDWLRPVEEAARSITVHDLTRFMPPEDEETRISAVLMLFGDGPDGPVAERSGILRTARKLMDGDVFPRS